MHVCHVNRPVSADFSVDVFFSLGFKTRAEIQPASSLRTPRSKYTCLGFVWITRGLARARAVLEDRSRWMCSLETSARWVSGSQFWVYLTCISPMQIDFAGVSQKRPLIPSYAILKKKQKTKGDSNRTLNENKVT